MRQPFGFEFWFFSLSLWFALLGKSVIREGSFRILVDAAINRFSITVRNVLIYVLFLKTALSKTSN